MKKVVETLIQIPVLNNSHHDAVLHPKVTPESLYQIQSISALEPLQVTDKENQQLLAQSNTINTTQNHQEVFSVNKNIDDHNKKF